MNFDLIILHTFDSNIFFSVLIGFIIFFIPTTDYFTRHYLTATMIVWATTFSLLTLFLPKLHAFFLPEEEESPEEILRKASDLSGRQRLNNRRTNTIGVKSLSSPDGTISEKYNDDDNDDDNNNIPPTFDFDNQSDMMSLNYMVNNSQHPFNNSTVKLSNISGNGRMHGIMMEVHEVSSSSSTSPRNTTTTLYDSLYQNCVKRSFFLKPFL